MANVCRPTYEGLLRVPSLRVNACTVSRIGFSAAPQACMCMKPSVSCQDSRDRGTAWCVVNACDLSDCTCPKLRHSVAATTLDCGPRPPEWKSCSWHATALGSLTQPSAPGLELQVGRSLDRQCCRSTQSDCGHQRLSMPPKGLQHGPNCLQFMVVTVSGTSEQRRHQVGYLLSSSFSH